MVATADDDGYLGIYLADLRFPTELENGEFRAQATLGRALLAYIEAAHPDLIDIVPGGVLAPSIDDRNPAGAIGQ